MRRIAAVFAPRRSDKSDAASSAAQDDRPPQKQLPLHTLSKKPSSARFFRSLSRKAQPPADHIVVRDSLVPSSSSSSSGGPSTPDDDRTSFVRSHDPKHWTPWSPDHADLALPVLVRAQAQSILQPPPHTSTHPTPPIRAPPHRRDSDPEEASSSDGNSDAHDGTPPRGQSNEVPEVVRSPPPVRGHSPAISRAPAEYARALTVNSLHPSFSPPPLLQLPNAPMFPRSCNPSLVLSPRDTLSSRMFKSCLLRRLERGSLTEAERDSLAPFASRRGILPTRKGPSLTLDDTAVTDAKRVTKHSEGLRRWTERPCFEDRFLLYLPAETGGTMIGRAAEAGIVCMRVSGTGLGVAALEYSETLELLSGLYDTDAAALQIEQEQVPLWSPTFEQTLPILLSPSSPSPNPASIGPPTPTSTSSGPTTASATPVGSSEPPQSTAPRPQPYKAMPSPLRMEHGTAVPSALKPALSPGTSPRTSSPRYAVPVVAAPSATSKPGVRFAETVPEPEEQRRESVPKEYVMRIKQQRAEKARFLEAERTRRLQEDERQKREEEQRRRQEDERAARRVREEQRQRAYTEEIARARARRESVRLEPEWERERERKVDVTRDGYSRAAYDNLAPPTPRRASEQSVQRDSSPARRSPGGRPSSIVASSSGSGRGSPVPPTTRSTSAPDIRVDTGSRRGSFISDASYRSPSVPTSPPWAGTPNGSPRMSMNMGMLSVPSMPLPMPVVHMMPVPVPVAVPMPMHMGPYGSGMMGMDAPLLPPAPPFAMHQFRSRSSSQERGSSQGQGQRIRAHSSSPAPQVSQQRDSQYRDSQPRAHSSSPTQSRSSRAVLAPPSAPRSSLMPPPATPHSHSHSNLQAPTSSRSARDLGHQRRLSADLDTHRQPHSSRDRDREQDRHSTKSGAVATRPSPRHSSTMPMPTTMPATPPVVLREARGSWAVPKEGFQILSRPQAGRRQTVIS